ncbi:hypothetical protein ACEQ8H_001973 [Pleosporales sp. CAS-2024a]
MHRSKLLSLPPAMLLLLLGATASCAAQEAPWPHNVPKHVQYFPQDEAHVRRAWDLAQRLKREKPVGVKKMSEDEGEMFLLDNWIFASDVHPRASASSVYANDTGAASSVYANDTGAAQSPLRPLADKDWFARMRVRAALSKRQFACPAGTKSCASMGAPDVCCGTASTCIRVVDSPGVGSVGCCPLGHRCAGSIRCDTQNGYFACPNAPNGGCCLPGFQCDGIGCAAVGTSITYVEPASSSPPAVVIVPTSAAATPAPSSSWAYRCANGYFSCPASLGGGCCENGRTCATGASCLGDAPSSTAAPAAPVRPTSGSVTSSASSPSSPANLCPTGFYACSAYYPSGCCRVGRDCQTTGSCALPASATVVNTNGVVVVAPSGAAVATTAAPQRGSCPSAWFSCAASLGGNCCPNGYACGEQCTATATASGGQSGTSPKVAPSSASFLFTVSMGTVALAALGAGVAMIVL